MDDRANTVLFDQTRDEALIGDVAASTLRLLSRDLEHRERPIRNLRSAAE